MLCQFSFQNYKSYRDEVTLDLCPAKITEHPEHLIKQKDSGESFLPLAVIYGPNGGGKSNVIGAFNHLRNKILDVLMNVGGSENHIKDAEGSGLITFNRKARPQRVYFIFDKSYAKEPTSWSISFIRHGYEYKYSISATEKKVVEESLYAKDLKTQDIHMLFERGKNVKFGELLFDIP